MKVTYNNKEYECTVALKRGSCAKLLDDAGSAIATFEGVKDYSLFTLSGGTWTDCPSTEDLTVPVLLPDGSILSSGKKLSEVGGSKIFIKKIDLFDFTYNTRQPGTYSFHIFRGVVFTSEVPQPRYATIPLYGFNTSLLGENALAYEDGNGDNGFSSLGTLYPATINYFDGASHLLCTAYTIKRTENGKAYYDTHVEVANAGTGDFVSTKPTLFILFIPVED